VSNYTKSTDFAAKDALASGNPAKVITGTAHDTEYNAIATAIATKADATNAVLVTPDLGTPSSGILTNCTASFAGAVSGTTGTFSGAISGTTGTFSGAISGTTGTFSGAVSGTTGTFSSGIKSSGAMTIDVSASNFEVNISGTEIQTRYVDLNQTANDRIADLDWYSGTFRGRFVNDAYGAATDWMVVTGGYAAGTTSIQFIGPTTITGAATITGTTTLATSLTGPLYATAGVVSVGTSIYTNSLGADVNLTNTASYFDGPSVAQGTSGKWFASGTVYMNDTATGSGIFYAKLWDGTPVIASGYVVANAGSQVVGISLSGYIDTPAGNIRISVRDTSTTSGKILYNTTGNSKDCTLTAFRIG